MKKDKLKEFGSRVKLYRLRAGLTQEELAEIVNLSPRTIQTFEAGANITLKNIYLIAEALNIKPKDLL